MDCTPVHFTPKLTVLLKMDKMDWPFYILPPPPPPQNSLSILPKMASPFYPKWTSLFNPPPWPVRFIPKQILWHRIFYSSIKLCFTKVFSAKDQLLLTAGCIDPLLSESTAVPRGSEGLDAALYRDDPLLYPGERQVTRAQITPHSLHHRLHLITHRHTTVSTIHK